MKIERFDDAVDATVTDTQTGRNVTVSTSWRWDSIALGFSAHSDLVEVFAGPFSLAVHWWHDQGATDG